jgi:PAS domain S-box-containing protein
MPSLVNILELVADQVSVAITRKQNEEALRESEEQFRTIFDSTSEAVLIFSMDGQITYVNQAACSMYGYSLDELIGLSAAKLIHPDYFHGFSNFTRVIKEKKRFISQSMNIKKDGTIFDVEVRGAGFTYRGQQYLVSITIDITERLAAELALKATKQKVEQLHATAQRLEMCENENDLYQETVAAAEKILDFTLASLDIVEGDRLVVKATSAELPPDASRESPLANGGLALRLNYHRMRAGRVPLPMGG